MAVSEGFVHFTNKYKYGVILFWVVCLGIGAWKAFAFIGETDFKFDPPNDSLAVRALEKLTEYFPNVGGFDTLVVLLQRTSGKSILGSDTQAFTTALKQQYTVYVYPSATPFLSYYTLVEQGLQAAADLQLSASGSATYISIQGDFGDNNVIGLENLVSSLGATYFPHGDTSASLTGEQAISRGVQDSIEGDMLLCDGISFPLALLIFSFTLKSIRLVVIPILTIITTLLTSFLIMYPIAASRNVISFAPSLMLSTTIAMSIDYSLFLLSRFREEILRGADTFAAVVIMMSSSGHTVLVSGMTLSLCFAGLLLFPMELLSSLGLGCCVAVAVAVIVNLTLTPSIILTFPNLFRRICRSSTQLPCRSSQQKHAETVLLVNHESDNEEIDDDMDDKRSGSPISNTPIDYSSSKWYKFGSIVVRYPLIVVVVVCGLLAYPVYIGITFSWTMNSMAYAPRGQAVSTAFADLQEIFGSGRLYPYQLLMIAPTNQSVLSPEFFNASQEFISSCLVPASPAGTIIISAFYYPSLEFSNITSCLASTASDCEATNLLLDIYITPDRRAVFFDIFLGVDPAGPDGVKWIKSIRDLVSSTGMVLAGGQTYNLDAVQAVYDAFPTAIGVTVAVVFVIVGIAFRSLLVPLRAVFTISLTLGGVYGAAAAVYQYGVLDFLGWPALQSMGALFWIPPVLSFSIMVGLGLDYDIFLLTRIIEFRKHRLSDRASVLMGLTRTGRIITAAGGIMAVAFFGLLFSKVALLNQMSFFLVFAVLLDTLVVRTMLVPAIMVLLRKANWWPSRMPPLMEDPSLADGGQHINQIQ